MRGGTLIVDARVTETRRPHVWEADFAQRVRAFLAGHDHDGWEPRHAVAGRFDAAVRDALASSHGAPVVVFSHGQALTLWLRSVGAVQDPAGFWSELRLPDAWTITLKRAQGALVAAGPPARIA